MLPDFQNFATLPLMLVMGALGGAAYAMIPALLKTRFGTNEILTSLMLVYVATLFLDWMVRGPWRDPMAFGFPNTITLLRRGADPLHRHAAGSTPRPSSRSSSCWCSPSFSRAR